jgi:flagellar FliJ protein
MPRFKFKLEAVLKVRTLREKALQTEFAVFSQKVEMLKSEIESIETRIEQFRGEITWDGNIQTNDLGHRQNWIDKLHYDRGEKLNDLYEKVKEKERLREVLLEATRDRKAIDKLRESHLEAFKLEQKKKEQAFSDEMSSVRHSSKDW